MKTFPVALLAVAALAAILTINPQPAAARGERSSITKTNFGVLPDGTLVELYTLRNARGMEVRICNYGGIIVSLRVPDGSNSFDNLVLGFDNLDDYVRRSPYFGAIVGRYANRIAKAKISLAGKEYQLAANNGPNHLHGGTKGFDKVVWAASTNFSGVFEPSLRLTYLSKDGEEGYPGNLSVTATYTLTTSNELRLVLTATTDRETIVNLTQHSYFNLAGKGDIFGHEFFIDADKFTPTDASLIPTGELRPVKDTPFDFTKPSTIKARLEMNDEQLRFARGIDHNFVLNKKPGDLALAARVVEPKSGRTMEVWTTEPGLQFYTSTWNSRQITGANNQRTAFCLEPGHFPDSPNHPDFPPVTLKPGQTYKNTILYKFSNR